MKTAYVNGLEFAYHEEYSDSTVNTKTGLKTVVFVHGFPLDHQMWLRCFPLLLRKFKENGTKLRLVAPDMRGFGKSQPKKSENSLTHAVDASSICTMEQFADDLAALCDSLAITEPITLCGLSMGGYIAMEFAKKYRQKLNALVLCDTKAVPDPPEGAKNRLKTAATLEEQGKPFLEKLVDGMIPKLFSEKSLNSQPELVAEVRNQMLSQSPQGLAAAARGMANRADSTKFLETVDLPISIICGKDDVISPPDEMRTIAENALKGSFSTVTAAGHLAPLENPREWVDRFVGD